MSILLAQQAFTCSKSGETNVRMMSKVLKKQLRRRFFSSVSFSFVFILTFFLLTLNKFFPTGRERKRKFVKWTFSWQSHMTFLILQWRILKEIIRKASVLLTFNKGWITTMHSRVPNVFRGLKYYGEGEIFSKNW